MHRRRLLTVVFASAALAACAPSIEKHSNPASTDYVLFDPSASQIPLPNDLALQPTSIAGTSGAQKELLQSFAAQGGFPNDQEAPITVDVQRFTYNGSEITKAPPPEPVDVGTVKLVGTVPSGANVAVFEKKAGATTPAPVDPTSVGVTYVPSADRGTITIENKAHAVTLSPGNVIQSRRWNAGSQYIVLVRGGASGVKLQGGGELVAQPTMYLLTRGADLSLPENEYLLPGNGRQGRHATGVQLETLRQQYLPIFGIAEQVFGAGATKDLVTVQTFQIAPAKPGTAVVTDASAGIVPLPSDLLLDPATGGKTIVNNPAFGPLASGIATLDGFSTTAMVLSQTSAPIVASTVAGSVFLYDLSNPAAPVRLKEITETAPTFAGAAYVAEPFLITQKPTGPTTTVPCTATDPATGCFSTAIGLQPAVGAPVSPTTQINLPPLKEGTEYAVLVTEGVKDTTGAALQGSTLSRILLFDNPLVDASGKSQVPGQTDATAAGLEKIRQGVGAAAAALKAEKGTTKDHIVLGYTFRTQTITQPALQLAAAPYQNPAAFVPASSGAPVTLNGVLLTNVQEIRSVPITTLNPINVQTGALEPDSTKWTPATLNALVVVPATTGTPTSPARVPLVVFQHGLGRNKGDVGPIASELATAGFAVAAIDAPLHGDRAYCESNAECTCTGGSPTCTTPTCTFFGPAGLQGDAVQIGQCSAGSVAVPAVSGRFLVTANFFRTRDALRQDILDNSALVLALAPPSVPSNPLAAELLSKGIAIDPTKVYWVGQSLGGILGTLNTAANPRISKAVLNVPGGTVVDVFTQSPSFTPQVNTLLAGLTPPITPGTPQYLQFIQVAKLVLDGAEPLNFGGHLLGDAAHPTLPDLLQSKPNQAAKSIFGQYAICDQVIPNPFNLLLFGEIGLASGTNPNPFTAYTVSGAGTAGACNTNPATNPAHGFLLNGVDPNATGFGQTDAAHYLLGALTPVATHP